MSDGYFFLNSINSEKASGGIQDKQPPFEAGVSKNPTDFLHIIDWRKAEAVFKAGKTVQIEGFPVIPLATAVSEGLLHITPEPRSPHGVDVTPNGEFIVVAVKLDPHVTVFSMEKIKKAIAAKTFSGTDD